MNNRRAKGCGWAAGAWQPEALARDRVAFTHSLANASGQDACVFPPPLLTLISILLTIIGVLLMIPGRQRGIVVGKKRQAVTDAELAVLKVLWARGPLSAKALADEVYPDGAESEFAAIHSFLQRLERKGLVTRDRSSFVHVFSATGTQADVLGQELRTLAERLGADSIAPLIMQLLSQKRLSRKEVAEIRKLLDKQPR